MFLRTFLSFFAVWISCAIVLATEVCFFDTGQGNCIAIKHNDRLVFIDCGGGTPIDQYRGSFSNVDDPYYQKLAKLAANITSCHFLITHNHVDHKNLIDTVAPIIQGASEDVEIAKNYLSPKAINGSSEVGNL
jgi:mRNA degradation ribonuclease J1/J2